MHSNLTHFKRKVKNNKSEQMKRKFKCPVNTVALHDNKLFLKLGKN